MRVIRGAGPRGMGGIPYARPVADAPGIRVIRPLLDCTRREIVQFLRQRGLRSRLDSTNLSRKYLRNRLRRLAIPEMKREWGERLTADLCSLAALAQRFQARSDAIRAALQSQHSVRVMNGYVETEAAWLRRMPPAMLPDLVQAWMKEAGLWRKMLSAREYERIAALLASRARPRRALRRRAGLCLAAIIHPLPGARRALTAAAARRSGISRPARGAWPHAHRAAGRRHRGGNPRRGKRTDRPQASDTGRIRGISGLGEGGTAARRAFPAAGDRMRPLGAPGSRKLQDIFTDLHVPPWLRTRTLVVTMEDRPDLDRRPPHRRRREAHRPNAQSPAAEIPAESLNLFISRGRCAVDSAFAGMTSSRRVVLRPIVIPENARIHNASFAHHMIFLAPNHIALKDTTSFTFTRIPHAVL